MNDKKMDQKLSKPHSFEDALKELEAIASQLELGTITLDESVNLLARGRFLYDFCAATLEEAQIAVNEIITDDNGAPIDKVHSGVARFSQMKEKMN